MTPRAGGAARVYALLVAFACAAVVPVPVLGAASAIVPVHGGATEVLELHGSGTTNPSKLFWKVMDILEERSKKPLTMTYRAVGSSTGQCEFKGDCGSAWTQDASNAGKPATHFGSGDIPFSSADHAAISTTAPARPFMHVPFMIGAIGVFHSVPADDLPASTRALNLDRCVLSGIFQRLITTWDHADILALNPGFSPPAGQPIKVVARENGSSSTTLAAKYLSDAKTDTKCRDNARTNAAYEWKIGTGSGGPGTCSTTSGSTRKCPDWSYTAPAASGSVVYAQGSGGVSGYLAANPYAIAYIDSGHGHAVGASEVKVSAADGTFISSKEADIPAAAAAAITAAASVSASPLNPANAAAPNTIVDAFKRSWDAVTLMNQGGGSFPICTFSYMYIDTDPNYLKDASGALLKAFAQFILSEEGQRMPAEFGFYPLPVGTGTLASPESTSLLKKARDAVDGLAPGGSPTAWTFESESSTRKGEGQGDYVFSGKRTAYADYERAKIVTDVASIKTQILDLQYNEVVQLHGSGTTNPQKVFWKVMDILEERARVPMSMSYRAVGSSTGQCEFIGSCSSGTIMNSPAYAPWNHFGSGDIPFSSADWTLLTNTNSKPFIHVPFQLGTISFFHSVPSSYGEIKLDACTLAKIFKTDINTWDHADIKAANPGFNPPAGAAIKVAHRTHGSSSTKLSTQYLNLACSSAWTLGTGSTITWPASTHAVEGSGGMTTYLQSNQFAIGYLDSGHGIAAGLSEVELKNAAGRYLKSSQADVAGVTAYVTLPSSAQADWSAVSLMNKPGALTWPITTFSYLYVRKDLTSMGRSGAAVKAFAQFLLSDEGQAMLPEFGFYGVSSAVKALANAGLASVKLASTAPAFIFESEATTRKGVGQQYYTLSGKRKTYAEIERATFRAELNAMVVKFNALKAQHDALAATMTTTYKYENTTTVYVGNPNKNDGAGHEEHEWIEQKADVALALALIGFLLAVPALVMSAVATHRIRFLGQSLNVHKTLGQGLFEEQRNPPGEQRDFGYPPPPPPPGGGGVGGMRQVKSNPFARVDVVGPGGLPTTAMPPPRA